MARDRATWAASDALCAALQIINHLQDCGKDYRDLDRVYLPQDACAAHGATVEALGGAEASRRLARLPASRWPRAPTAYLEPEPPLADEIRDSGSPAKSP